MALQASLNINELMRDLHEHYLRQFDEPIASTMAALALGLVDAEIREQNMLLARASREDPAFSWRSLQIYS